MNTPALRIAALSAYLIMVSVNFLAVTLPLAGRDTGAISDSYPNLFAPAGYTFSIWGIIYTLLALYTLYQLRWGSSALFTRVNRLFIANALLNSAWIFAWHYDYIGLSVLIMVGILTTLILIADTYRNRRLTSAETWFVRLPFSTYFGWITVAMIANITTFLVSVRWPRFGLSEVFWTVTILLVGAGIGSWRLFRDRTIAYGLVLMWAYTGILSKHLSAGGFAGQYPAVINTVILSMLVFAGSLLCIGFKTKAQ